MGGRLRAQVKTRASLRASLRAGEFEAAPTQNSRAMLNALMYVFGLSHSSYAQAHAKSIAKKDGAKRLKAIEANF